MRSIKKRARLGLGGFSLLEVIIALAILGIGIAALVSLYSSSLRATRNSADYTRAMILATDLLEAAYARPEEPADKSISIPGGIKAERNVSVVGSGQNSKTFLITVDVYSQANKRILELIGKKTVNEGQQP